MSGKSGGGEGPPSPYPAPKPQDLSLLARKIQRGEVQAVRAALAKNPRLLSTGTDGPPILQEGFRYNALHIAARAGNAEIATIILAHVNGISFMRRLYPDDSQPVRNARTRYLTDMYLNTPDKGALETPLHFACKFSFYDIVKLLINHPLCDTTVRNREGKTADEIIGTRGRQTDSLETDRIRLLFVENRIVPIWRDPVNESQPVVGKPVNPKYLGNFTPAPFTRPYGDVVLEHFGPPDLQCIPRALYGSQKVIRAYAGPTDEETALQFYHTLKTSANMGYGLPSASDDVTPPGSPTPSRSNFNNYETPEQPQKTNGFEQAGVRNHQMESIQKPLQTSTPIQVTPPRQRRPRSTDLTPKSNSSFSSIPRDGEFTPTTLSLLLTSPRAYTPGKSPSRSIVEDRSIRLGDPSKGVERVARKYAKEEDIPWNEYWAFMDEFCDLASPTGLALLEAHLQRNKHVHEEIQARQAMLHLSPVSLVCHEMSNLALGSGNSPYIRQGQSNWTEDWRNGLVSQNQTTLSSSATKNGEFTETEYASARRASWNDNSLSAPAPIKNQMTRRNSEFMSNINARRQSFNDYSSVSASPSQQEKQKMVVKRLFPKLNDSFCSVNESNSSQSDTYLNRSRDSISSDDDNHYTTAPSSPVADYTVYDDCDNVPVYVNGAKPGHEDHQAYRALLPVIEEISAHDFPLIVGWFNALKGSGDKFRKV